MKKTIFTSIFAMGTLVLFTGCDPANVQSQMRTTVQNTNMMTRCEEVDLRSNSSMSKLFSRYDGWRVFYISEFTTSNRFGTSATVCFEKEME